MLPTMASKARAHRATPLKRSDSASASMEKTQPSAVSAQAAKANTTVTNSAQAQQFWDRRGVPGHLFEVNGINNADPYTIVQSPADTATDAPNAPVAPAPPMAPLTPTEIETDKHAVVPASVPTQEPTSAKGTTGNLALNASDTDRHATPTPDITHAIEAPTKRKRSDDNETPIKKSTAVERKEGNVGKGSTDAEPPSKKRKTRSSAPEKFLELGSDGDDDVVVVAQRKRKSATIVKAREDTAAIEKLKSAAKSQVSELDKLIKQEEKRKSSAARGNIFSRNPKLRRSFNDTLSASRMSRPRPIPQAVTSATPRNTIEVARSPIAKDSSSAVHAPDAFAVDEEDPNVTHANLRTIKYINVTATVRNVHIDRIVQSPFQYPNVVIEFDENDRPMKAQVTKMTDDEYKVACEAALGREKEKRKLDAKLARKNKFGTAESSLHKVQGGKVARKPRTSRARP
ncbi:uncharacterized protein N0V89_001961 [Didymosphaeria variabile]|uniref:Uncharacterized protein n=1 Tax=Didymosphaeria variabile TaxID=1932322 RepID=A0A9W8XRM8_9PLEO|nr:uncharacterized protein N0V89_001961 [Didymosphaeria variabile]KAJ4357386.1 hypothetical protein N0V89_001961 [Didymosphaeria variabile]